MEISDFHGTSMVNTDEELESVLMRRHLWEGAKVNSFWFCKEGRQFPLLSILVRDLFAYAWYAPRDDHPGFNSVGTINWIDANGFTDFALREEHQSIPNSEVITFVQALRVAKQFLHSQELPNAIKWSEL